MTKTIAWQTGIGNIYLTYNGSGNGQIVVTSDDNNLLYERRQDIAIVTDDGSIRRVVTVVQKAQPYSKDFNSDFNNDFSK